MKQVEPFSGLCVPIKNEKNCYPLLLSLRNFFLFFSVPVTLPLKEEYIVFLLDSSSTVRPEQFTKQKSLVKILAKYLNVGSANKTKSAVINYGGSPITSVKFNDSSTLRDFERSVDKITPRQG